MSEWSPPDHRGIISLTEGFGQKRTLRGVRRKRSQLDTPRSVSLLSQKQKTLLRTWLKQTSERRKWETLIAGMGFHDLSDADELVDTLLEAGWIETEEKRRDSRGWDLMWITFRHLELLREEVGLKNRDKQKARVDNLESSFTNPQLQVAAADLEQRPDATRLARHALLESLDQWRQEDRQGTRRDFALFARGTTKSLSSTEWDWLEGSLDLAEFGVHTHTPQIKLLIPGLLSYSDGSVDWRLLGDFVGLTEKTLRAATGFEGPISEWVVIENLTTFEYYAAEAGPTTGVLWVPGFAPSWWVSAVTHLVSLARAPARVACDPDPAGLLIAEQVGRVWDDLGEAWSPWMMFPDEFEGRGQYLQQTKQDRKILEDFRLKGAQSPLKPLFNWLDEGEHKLEQESFFNGRNGA